MAKDPVKELSKANERRRAVTLLEQAKKILTGTGNRSESRGIGEIIEDLLDQMHENESEDDDYDW